MKQIEIETIEIESSVRKILNEISSRTRTSALKPTHQQKFDTWIQQLTDILNQISKIDSMVLPLIKKDLEYPFTNKNLIVTAMVQPSLKNTFDEIKVHFNNEPGFEIFQETLTKLGTSPDTAKSLAWLGDAAIKYAILQIIWKPGITIEVLHNKRQELENNENLSKLCDKWNLFNCRIHLDSDVPKQETLPKIKGTLAEAIFGVILIEKKIEGVQEAIHFIDTSIK